jgi:hypothetical protein
VVEEKEKAKMLVVYWYEWYGVGCFDGDFVSFLGYG